MKAPCFGSPVGNSSATALLGFRGVARGSSKRHKQKWPILKGRDRDPRFARHRFRRRKGVSRPGLRCCNFARPHPVERTAFVKHATAVLRNWEFFHAPLVGIVCMHRNLGPADAMGVGMHVQTLLLALTERGLGTCKSRSRADCGHLCDPAAELAVKEHDVPFDGRAANVQAIGGSQGRGSQPPNRTKSTVPPG
jgi:hypothetical protein